MRVGLIFGILQHKIATGDRHHPFNIMPILCDVEGFIVFQEFDTSINLQHSGCAFFEKSIITYLGYK